MEIGIKIRDIVSRQVPAVWGQLLTGVLQGFLDRQKRWQSDSLQVGPGADWPPRLVTVASGLALWAGCCRLWATVLFLCSVWPLSACIISCSQPVFQLGSAVPQEHLSWPGWGHEQVSGGPGVQTHWALSPRGSTRRALHVSSQLPPPDTRHLGWGETTET